MICSRQTRFQLVAAAVVAFSATTFAQVDKVARSFSEVVKKVEPAVVSIDAKSQVSNQPIARGTPAPGDSDDIMDFFRRQQRPTDAIGSGFIVDKAGYIITNNHVIEDAGRITVKLDSGEEYTATVVGTDEETDIAVLKINAGHDLPVVKFANSDKAEVGDWVLTIGSPFNLEKTVSAGIVSQTKRQTPATRAFQKFIQTDAVINPGNSGGPLINVDGEVLGVNSQIATSTGEYNGVGFALPSNDTAYVYDQILKNGKVRRGYLGAYLDSVKAEFAKVYGLKEAKGAIITSVTDNQGPAAMAGLKSGDIVQTFNGQTVENAQDLIEKIAVTPPDQSVSITVLRENGANLENKTLTTKLGERPAPRNNRTAANSDRRTLPVDGGQPTKPLGLTLSELTPTVAAKYRLDTQQKGLVVEDINQASVIADVKNVDGSSALSTGDVIQRINRTSVTDVRSFEKVVSGLKVGDPVVMQVFSARRGVRILQFTVR